MRLRRFSELPADRKRPGLSSTTRSPSPAASQASDASDASMPRKRLRKFSETPKKRPERLERLAAKRRSEKSETEPEESEKWIVSEEESEISLSYYANADREIFAKVERYVEMSSERNFSNYLEYVAFALAGLAAGTGWSADELARYKGVVGKFEKEVFTRRDAASGRWPPEMRDAVEKFPTLQLSREGFGPGTLCHACNRKGDTVVEGTLAGNSYDTRNFHGKISDLEQSSETAVAEFMAVRARPVGGVGGGDESYFLTLSAHCAKKVEEYHRLHHWKWRIFNAVYRWLLENRKTFETASQAAEVVKNDTAFVQRMSAMNSALFGDDRDSDF